MAGLSDYSARMMLTAITSKGTFTNVATAWLGLFSVIPTDAAAGGTEAAYTGYARQAMAAAAWNAAAGSAPSTISNAGTVSFPICTNSGTSVVETLLAWGLFDAVTSGNQLFTDYLGNNAWIPFICTLASPGVLSAPAHGFANGDKVVVSAEIAGTLPTTGGSWSGPLTVANVTADTFTLGVNTTGTGGGLARKIAQQPVVANLQPLLAPGAFVLGAA